jgi:hypothetical protein
MPPVGFEPTIPASARPQTYASDSAAAGIGITVIIGSVFGSFQYCCFLLKYNHDTNASLNGYFA